MSVPVAEDEPEPARGNIYRTLPHFTMLPLPSLSLPLFPALPPLFPTLSPITPPLPNRPSTLVITAGLGGGGRGGRARIRVRIRTAVSLALAPRLTARPGEASLPRPIQSLMRSHSNGHGRLVDGLVEWVQETTDERTPGVGLSGRNQRSIYRTRLVVVFLLLFFALVGLLCEIRRIIVDLSAETVAALCQDDGHTTWAEEVLLRRSGRENYPWMTKY
jgi:hypothetical protein